MRASQESKSSGFPPYRDASWEALPLPKAGIMRHGSVLPAKRWDASQSRVKPTIPTPTKSWGDHGIPTRQNKHYSEHRFAKLVKTMTGSPRPPITVIEILMGLPANWLSPYSCRRLDPSRVPATMHTSMSPHTPGS